MVFIYVMWSKFENSKRSFFVTSRLRTSLLLISGQSQFQYKLLAGGFYGHHLVASLLC